METMVEPQMAQTVPQGDLIPKKSRRETLLRNDNHHSTENFKEQKQASYHWNCPDWTHMHQNFLAKTDQQKRRLQYDTLMEVYQTNCESSLQTCQKILVSQA